MTYFDTQEERTQLGYAGMEPALIEEVLEFLSSDQKYRLMWDLVDKLRAANVVVSWEDDYEEVYCSETGDIDQRAYPVSLEVAHRQYSLV